MNIWALLWRLIRHEIKLYTLVALCWVISFVSLIGSGAALQAFFDGLEQSDQMSSGILGILLLWVAAALVRALIRPLIFYLEPTLMQRPGALISKNMLTHIFNQPGARALTLSSGETFTRFRDDVNAIGTFMIWSPVMAGRIAFTLIALVIMINISPLITLVSLVPLVLIAITFNAVSARVQTYRRASLKETGKVTETINEMFQAVQAIKLSDSQEYLIKHFESLNGARRKAMIKDRLMSEIMLSFSANLINMITAIVLLLSSQGIREGSFSLGDFALFIYYLQWVMDFIYMCGALIPRSKQVKVSFERIQEALQNAESGEIVKPGPTYLDGPLPTLTPLGSPGPFERLVVRDLGCTHLGGQRGIENISFQVQRGDFMVITGRVGSGKTTLVRALLGLLPKTSGTITWDDQPVSEPGAFLIPPRVAYTPQSPRLFSETIKDNILLGLEESAVDLPRAIRLAVMEQDLAAMESGLESVVGAKGARLSGGQIQRTAAARMFVRGARLLVLDDLSSALDVNTEQQLWENLQAQDDLTCIIVSHRPGVLRRASSILLLKDGGVAARGTFAELFKDSEDFRQLYQMESMESSVQDLEDIPAS